MTATDLMIGDWVCYDGDTMHECPVQIDGISKEEASVEGDWYDEWEPIPLTPEILEKNRFEKYPYKNSYWYCDEMLELFVKIVCIFPIEDRKLRSSLPAPAPRLSAGEDDVYIRCDYVHELQHALKFCGIDKEIVL